MNRTLSRRHRIVLLPLLAVASLITGLSAPAGAAPTSLRAQLDLNSPATIQSGSSAGFTLHWSVNDAPSSQTTIAMTLPEGVSIAPGSGGTVKLPDACITGSSIATDGRSFVCELGAKDEGTWGALGLTLGFAGSNNDTFPVSYTLSDGTATVTSNPQTITVTATPQAELLAGFRAFGAGPTAGSGVYAVGLANITDQNGVNGRIVYVPVRIEVPIGGEPVTGATFDLDWSGFKTTWPNTRPVDFPVAPLPGQANCAPWAIPGWGPAGKQGTNGATGADAVIDSGSWSCATTGTTTKVTITGISPSPSQAPGAYLAGYKTVANGVFGLFIPASDEPFGTSTGVATVKNIAMTTKSGLTALDQNTPNNDASFSIQRFAPGGFHDGAASWTQDIAYYEARPDSSALTQTIGWLSRWAASATAGNPNLSPSLTSSLATDYNNRFSFFPNKADNGLGLTSPGATIYATTVNDLKNYSTADHGDYALCTKWDPTITTLAPAPSTVQKIDSTFTNNSAVENQSGNTSSTMATPGTNPAHPFAMATMQDYKELPEGFNLRFNLKSGLVYGRDYIIQYGRIANQSTSDCGDAAALSGWHDDPAAVTGGPVNAVRAVTLGDQFPQIRYQDYRWTLDVPLKVNTALPKGTNVPFWSVRKMLPVQPSNGPALPLDSVWIGEGVYNATNHTGDARYGSRITTTGTALTISKVTEFGDTPVAVKLNQQVDFTIEAVVHGDGTVPLTIEDIVGKGMEYVPGTATITTGPGITAPAGEPTITAPPSYLSSIASSQLNWDFGSIVGVNGQKVTIKYTAKANSDAVAGGTGLNVAIARGGDNENGAASVTPDKPNGVVAFRSFTFSNSYWELNVHKQAGSTPIFPGQDASYSLNYRNDGSKEAGSVTFIDVFPFNGDNNAPELGDNEPGREVGSDFAGTLKLASATGTDETFLYTKAAPTSISLDPLATSNTPVTGTTVWCQPVGGTQPLYGHFGDAGCPANLAEATAVRFTTGAALKPAQARSVQLVFHTTGNAAGDLYTNNYGGRVNPPSSGSAAGTPVLMGISNDVTIKVRALRLGDYVWNDTDHDGIQDAGESPIAGVTVELLDATNTVIGTTTTDAAGKYLFDGLVPGDYKVRFTTPAGFAPTLTTAGSDTTVDSNPTGGVASVTLDGTEVNDENLTIDAGFYPLLSLGNYTWFDIDRDGIQDAGEPALEGVVVTLTDNNGDPVVDGYGNPVPPQTTGPDGLYLFEDLVSELYVVTFTPPASYTFTDQGEGADTEADSDADPDLGVAQVLLEEDRLDIDAGFIRPVATIGNYVWFDADLDGIQDADEDPVEGVTATLTDDNGDPVVDIDGNPVAPQATDPDGLYLFANLVPGTYTVTFSDLPADFVVTQTGAGSDPAVDSNGLTATTTVGAFEEDLTLDLGIYKLVSVGDYVWLDADRDGVQDSGEAPVPDVTVTLLDANGDEVATTTTDADGLYLFDGLTPGAYSIVFSDLPSGLSFTQQNAGSDDNVDSDADPADGSVSFNLPDDRRDIDAGLVRPLVSIGDYVWFDHNRNGVQDSAENPVEGVTVNLLDANGDQVATTTTDADGFYSFGDLEPSTGYAVEFVAPSGYHFTDQDAGSDNAVDSDANPTTGIALVTTPANGSNSLTNPDDPTIDAGFVRLDLTLTKDLVSSGPFYLGDEVTFELTPHNEGPSDAHSGWSVTDVLPSGLELVSIDGTGYACVAGTLTCTSSSPLAAGEDGEVITVVATITETDTTLTNVAYVTPAPGEVTEDVPLGTPPTSATDTDASTTNNDGSAPVVVSPLVSLGDYTWIDSDRDGVQDSGEAPLPGVTVVLLDSNGDPVAMTTTDADGLYLFTDLVPGDYTVIFTAPAGYNPTTSGAGSDTDVDSDPASDGSVDVDLTTDRRDIDAGFTPPAVSLGNYVWFDDNHDGIQDSSEDPVPGVTVTLTDADGNAVVDNQGNTVAPAVTDADGLYLFSDLPPGDYTVVFSDLPADTAITLTGAGSDTAADSNGLTASTSLPNDGDEDLTLDLGLVRLAAIGDRVWFDIDRNGIQDQGEDSVEGVTVTLTDSDGNVVDTTVTDGDGRYLFDGLFPGDYRVTFSDLPAGYQVTTTGAGSDTAVDSNGLSSVKVALAAGETDLTYDLGLWLPASVGDFVWLDANADGIQDQGEAPVPGVTVTLLDADGNELATTTTDADGAYLFDQLVPGDYLVRFTAPNGYVISPTNIGSDTAVDSDGITTAVTLDAGEHDPTIDLGIYRPASLGDFVWLDMDADGIQDQGEAPVPGVTVTLLDADGNELATTTTDADGAYLFDGLAPGTYTVTFSDLPADHAATTTGAGSDNTVDSNGLTTTVTLAENEHNPTIDLGIYPLAAIGDRVWFDLDRNGIQDEGEESTPGVTVTLLDGDGNEVATATTDADGRYLFDGLRPGDYTVVFSDLPADYEVTTTSAGNNPAVDSNGLSSVKVALAAGETDLTYDLGLWLPASVGDFVWLDNNANGIQDQGEAPVPGVVVNLFDPQGDRVATTTTDADGHYVFDGLVPGDYTVEFVLPDGYVISPTGAGDDTAVDSDGLSTGVNLDPGEHDPTIDLGIYQPASLGDFVWLDTDRDGIQDQGEAPVPGVTVTLLDADGDELATTTTDADGAYLFDGLAPGTYTVRFSDLPAGLVVTTTYAGSDRSLDSNNLETTDITLAAGEHNPTIDLGLYRPTIDIELVKYVNGDDANEAPGITIDGGSEVTWTYEITNTGEVDLVELTLVDDIEGDVVCPQDTLAVDETITCTLTGVAVDGPYTNIGTVTGTNANDPAETVTDDDPANYTGIVINEPPTTVPTTKPTTPPAAVDQDVAQRNPLVTTGADVLVLVLVGSALLAGGFLILGMRRRRSANAA